MKVSYGGKQMHARLLRNRLNPIYRGKPRLPLNGLRIVLTLQQRPRFGASNLRQYRIQVRRGHKRNFQCLEMRLAAGNLGFLGFAQRVQVTLALADQIDVLTSIMAPDDGPVRIIGAERRRDDKALR